MPRDEHSIARAERSAERALFFAQRDHRRHPYAAPLSARESTLADEGGDEPKKAAAKPPPDDEATVVRGVVAAVDGLREGALHAHTTDAERRRLRLATCPPAAALERSVQGDVATSLATVALLAGCAGLLAGCLASSSRAVAPSPAAAPRASSAASQRVARDMARYAV